MDLAFSLFGSTRAQLLLPGFVPHQPCKSTDLLEGLAVLGTSPSALGAS